MSEPTDTPKWLIYDEPPTAGALIKLTLNGLTVHGEILPNDYGENNAGYQDIIPCRFNFTQITPKEKPSEG